MQKIQCPNCGEFFQVDENSYAQIAQQVRDKEFEKALNQQAKNEVEKACLAKETEYQKVLREKDSDRADLRQQLTELQKQLQGSETEKKLAVNEAVQQKEREYSDKLEQKKERTCRSRPAASRASGSASR